MKTDMKIFVVFATILLPLTALSEDAVVKLEVKVIKRSYGEQSSKPFTGVGVFDVLRGKGKMDGASCPDKSGVTGSVSCTIPCKADQESSVIIRLKAPADQDYLAGWVTPPPQDIELRGCKLLPQSVTMRYDDAKYALNELILNKYASADPPSQTSTKIQDTWKSILYPNSGLATKITAGASSSSTGRANLIDIYKIASEGTKANKLPVGQQSQGEITEGQALVKWQILTKSALLNSQIEKTIPASQYSILKFSPTEDVTTYVTNLKKADELLGKIKEKTSEQQKLADDIKTLRSMPATGKDAQSAVSIIQQWE